MNTSSSNLLTWLILTACVVSIAGCNKSPTDRAIGYLSEPGEVIVYAVEPIETAATDSKPIELKEPLPEAVRQRRMVVDSVKVVGEPVLDLKALVKQAIVDESQNTDDVTPCLGGSHAIAFTSGTTSYFYLFTFECRWVEVFVNGKFDGCILINDSPKAALDRLLGK